MINIREVNETNEMIQKENLDVRTITMGISLLDCTGSTLDEVCDKIYDKITTSARDLVKVGEDIELQYGMSKSVKRSAWNMVFRL